jgi:hypothetical protein
MQQDCCNLRSSSRISEPERLCPSPGTRRTLLVWLGLRSTQSYEYHPFVHEADHEGGAEVIAQLTETRDDVDDRWLSGMLEVRVSGIDVE